MRVGGVFPSRGSPLPGTPGSAYGMEGPVERAELVYIPFYAKK